MFPHTKPPVTPFNQPDHNLQPWGLFFFSWSLNVLLPFWQSVLCIFWLARRMFVRGCREFFLRLIGRNQICSIVNRDGASGARFVRESNRNSVDGLLRGSWHFVSKSISDLRDFHRVQESVTQIFVSVIRNFKFLFQSHEPWNKPPKYFCLWIARVFPLHWSPFHSFTFL